MSLLTIRARTRAEHEPQLQQPVAALFEALHRDQPQNVQYASLRPADGSYLILVGMQDGTENPMTQLAEFQRFQQGLSAWADGPAVPVPAEVVGSYRAL